LRQGGMGNRGKQQCQGGYSHYTLAQGKFPLTQFCKRNLLFCICVRSYYGQGQKEKARIAPGLCKLNRSFESVVESNAEDANAGYSAAISSASPS
jgi:hypothetical protein